MLEARTDAPARRRGRALPRFALRLAVLAISLALIEGVSSISVRTFSTGRYRREEVSMRYHPFLGWDHAGSTRIDTTKANMPGKAFLDLDERGRSITPIAYAEPEIHVVVTGGSTIFGIGASSNETTLPSALERAIRDERGVEAEVTNLGVRGYQSFQELLQLREYFLTEKADLVLSIGGFNDAWYAGTQQHARSAALPDHAWEVVEPIRRIERGDPFVHLTPWLRERCATYDLLYRIAESARSAPGTEEAPPMFDPSNVEDRARQARAHYAMMAALCRQYGCRFAMVLQPTPYTRARPTPDEMKWAQMHAEDPENRSFQNYLRRYNAAFRTPPFDFEFRDLTGAFDGSEGNRYIDMCHYDDDATRELASAILTEIAPLLER